MPGTRPGAQGPNPLFPGYSGHYLGLVYMPLDGWAKGYLAVSMAFTLSSTVSISKTTRDLHEGRQIHARIEEARVEKLLADHHPLK